MAKNQEFTKKKKCNTLIMVECRNREVDECPLKITSRIQICNKMYTIIFKIKKSMMTSCITGIEVMSKMFAPNRAQLTMFTLKFSETN